MGKDRKNYRKETSESEKAKSLLDEIHTKYDDDDLLEEILMETLDSDKGKKRAHISDVDLSDILGNAAGNGLAPAAHPHQAQVLRALVVLHDLMGDAHQGPVQPGLVLDLRFELHAGSFPSGQEKMPCLPARHTKAQMRLPRTRPL